MIYSSNGMHVLTGSILLLLSATAALTAELPISGVFGDELGCARLDMGPNDIDEPGGINVLTDGLQGYEWGCTWAEVWPYPNDRSYGVQGLCSGEGIPSLEQFIIELGFDDPTQMTVFSNTGEELWELNLCEGVPGPDEAGKG